MTHMRPSLGLNEPQDVPRAAAQRRPARVAEMHRQLSTMHRCSMRERRLVCVAALLCAGHHREGQLYEVDGIC